MIIILTVGIVILLTQKTCSEIAPPKSGQIDPHVIQRGDNIYFCQTYWEKIFKNLKPSSSESTGEEIGD